ncbi:hypothetical protein CASFOL_031440 [Castilleja foliolosa]|uniref:RING-type E3 ubiquitin transferase n=1 Tax=Castilleja foliolosa TaxID=1961234 RepID=A0ABD3C5D9_9LAMI
MAAFTSLAVNNAYYDNRFTSQSLHHHYPIQNEAIFGYIHAGYTLMYSQYWVPLYYLQYQPQSCDVSWILNAQDDEEEEDREESNDYHQFMPCDDESLILNAQEDEEEEIELSEEELREWDLLDGELVFYDASDDDDGLSEDTVTKHLKTRDHDHHQLSGDSAEICVVCQDCLFQEDEKIATLDCGHDFHMECIKSWLMVKNNCPLCKEIGIRL